MNTDLEFILNDLQAPSMHDIKKLKNSNADISLIKRTAINEVKNIPPYYFLFLGKKKIAQLSKETLLNLTRDQIKVLSPTAFSLVDTETVKSLYEKFKTDKESNKIGKYMPDDTFILIKGQSLAKIMEKAVAKSEMQNSILSYQASTYSQAYMDSFKSLGYIPASAVCYYLSMFRTQIPIDSFMVKDKNNFYDYNQLLCFVNENYVATFISDDKKLEYLPRLYSASELALLTNQNIFIIKYLTKNNILPYYKLGAKMLRYSLDEFNLARNFYKLAASSENKH